MSVILTLLMLGNDGQRTLPPQTPFEDVTDDQNGQWVTVQITVETTEDEINGNTFYGCVSNNEISRSVCFKGYIDLNEYEPHVVMGKLRIINHGPACIDGEEHEGFTEYRLEKAVLIR